MNKVDLDGLDPAVEPDSEKYHRVAKIAVGAIPVVGGPLVEIFTSILESPLNKRRTETMVQIGKVINELLEAGVVTEEGLQQNEAFISTVADVCNISLRNHQEAKLEALRNAVKNSAQNLAPSDDLRQIFLNFVDVCTVTHIRLLKLMRDPVRWIKDSGREIPSNWYMGGVEQVIDYALPELANEKGVYRTVWKDLYQRGLLDGDNLGTTMTVQGMTSSRTTHLANMLLDFIS